jgi:hypothetical protein
MSRLLRTSRERPDDASSRFRNRRRKQARPDLTPGLLRVVRSGSEGDAAGEFRFDDEGGARRATAEHLETVEVLEDHHSQLECSLRPIRAASRLMPFVPGPPRSCGAGVRRDCCNEAPQRLSRSPRGAYGVEQLSSTWAEEHVFDPGRFVVAQPPRPPCAVSPLQGRRFESRPVRSGQCPLWPVAPARRPRRAQAAPARARSLTRRCGRGRACRDAW